MHSRAKLALILFVTFSSLAVIFSFSIRLGSAQVETTPEPTVFSEDDNPFPTFPLACPDDMLVSDGPTWRTITIGQSSLDDIENLYGVRFTLEAQRPWLAGSFAPVYSILLTAEGANRWKLPQSADLCIVDGKIMVLTLGVGTDEELPPGWIEEWVKLYGEPKLVTWTAQERRGDWCWRVVVWPEEGLAATVDVSTVESHPGSAWVNSVTLFPYAEGDDYLSSWPYSGLNRQPPTSSNNEGCPTTENPFDFVALLQVTTEQP